MAKNGKKVMPDYGNRHLLTRQSINIFQWNKLNMEDTLKLCIRSNQYLDICSNVHHNKAGWMKWKIWITFEFWLILKIFLSPLFHEILIEVKWRWIMNKTSVFNLRGAFKDAMFLNEGKLFAHKMASGCYFRKVFEWSDSFEWSIFSNPVG